MVGRRRYKPPVHQRGYGVFNTLLKKGSQLAKNLLRTGLRHGKKRLKQEIIKRGPGLINRAQEEIFKQAKKRSPLVAGVLNKSNLRGNRQRGLEAWRRQRRKISKRRRQRKAW